MNKKHFSFLFIFILLINTHPFYSQGKMFFDVKTKFAEKASLTHIKNAAIYLLLNSEWANVTEVGEEYAIWLRNYSKTQEYNVFTTKLDIEIREPEAFGEGVL